MMVRLSSICIDSIFSHTIRGETQYSLLYIERSGSLHEVQFPDYQGTCKLWPVSL